MTRSTQRSWKIALITPEVHPFAKTGGLGDVAGALPAAFERAGAEVTVITPYFRQFHPAAARSLAQAPFVQAGAERQVEFLEGTLPGTGVRVLFIDSPPEFDRPGIYGEEGRDYPDNALRFGLFCQAAILAAHRWCDPDILHLHDWTTGLIPVYLRTGDRNGKILDRARIVFTVHNLGYQGLFDPSCLGPLGIDPALFSWQGLEFWGQLNFLKGGLLFSDLITTVSPTYAREIQQEDLGCGLEGILRERSRRLVGILNGVDYREWNPETDLHLARTFSASSLLGKSHNKTEIRKTFGLERDKDAPLAAMVSRLASHKGIDLLLEAMEQVLALGAQVVILGAGEPRFEERVAELPGLYPGRVGARVGFDIPLSHLILAGADMLLVPSRYEPCGLTHLYGMRYGTVPIARATGGLADTVHDVGEDPAGRLSNGFLFSEATPAALTAAVGRAVDLYRDAGKVGRRTRWSLLRERCMRQDWSWDRVAPLYLDLFEGLLDDRRAAPSGRPAGLEEALDAADEPGPTDLSSEAAAEA